MIRELSSLTGLPRGVRLAVEEDLDEMVMLGKLFAESSGLPPAMHFDRESAIESGKRMLADDRSVILVTEDETGVTGILGGYLTTPYFNRTVTVAQEVFWFVRPECRSIKSIRLLDAFETWAVQHGAKAIWFSSIVAGSFEGMTGFMQKRGYAPVEMALVREV